MVQAFSHGEVVSLQSTITLTEEQAAIAKDYPKKVSHLAKDLHINHNLSESQDGRTLSIAGRMFDNGVDIEEATKEIQSCHASFVEAITNMKESVEEVESQDATEHFEIADKIEKEIPSGMDFCLVLVKNKKICVSGNIDRCAVITMLVSSMQEHE